MISTAVQVIDIGDDLGFVLPESVVMRLALVEGDSFEVRDSGDGLELLLVRSTLKLPDPDRA